MLIFTRIRETIHRYCTRPEIISVWVVVVVGIGVVIVNGLYAPILITALTAVILIGIALMLFRASVALARARIDGESSQKNLSAIIENLDDGVILYNETFTILKFNTIAETIFRITAHEVIGKTIDPGYINQPRFQHLAQTLFPSLAPTVSQLSEPSAWPQVMDISLENPQLNLRTTVHRLVDANGASIGFLILIRDRTRERSILKGKSEFITVAAHQLRTPLTAIGWAIENLQGSFQSAPAEAKELLSQIRQLSERTLHITNDLLDASKIEDGQFGYTFENTDVVSLIRSVLQEITVVTREYSVKVYFDPQEPEFLVYMDPARITTVLGNLLENAVRYNTKNGKVTVRIDRIPQKPFVKISVEDTGVGVPEEDTRNIFQKLYRGSNVKQLEQNGTGLGLYISHNIVRRHGGTMGFESTTNRGSTFWFTLPLDPSLIPPKEVAYKDVAI